jgi:hypothetical protein
MELTFTTFKDFLLEFKTRDKVSFDVLWALSYFEDDLMHSLCFKNLDMFLCFIEILKKDLSEFSLPIL